MPNWVVWKYEQVGDRQTKIPYQTNSRKAKSNSPGTWTKFEEAVEASANFDGIGWCVPLDGPVYYWGFDADDAIDPDTGEFKTWPNAPVQPEELLELASYAEITPSRAGFRVIAKCDFPVPQGQHEVAFGLRNPKTGKIPGIETYCKGRFFTFSGDVVEGAPHSVEDRSEQIRALHARLFPRGERPESKPKSGSTLTQTATIPQPAARIAQATNTKDQLVSEVLAGHIPGTPRNDLTVGIMGVLVAKGWELGDIEEIVKVLVAGFRQSDPSYDVEGTITKQLKELDRLYTRRTTNQVIPGFKYLERTLTPDAIQKLRSLVAGDSRCSAETSGVKSTLALIRSQPPESFEHQEIKYLIEPEIPKGALVLVTGAPGSGKSTLVMHWSMQMALAGNEVLYLDRDNPLFIAQERIERFGGKTVDGLMYWGLWTKDALGEPLEPPYPDSDFLKEAVRQMKNPVVVFDTFATFSNGDENDNAVVGATFKRLRHLTNLGATVLVIHHKGKNAGSKYRGASAMEGAVDAGVEVVGTVEEGQLTRIEVQTFKTRIGDGKPIVYGMRNGIPHRETATSQEVLLDLARRNPGISKEKFEAAARSAGFRRSTIRDFIDHAIVAGQLKYESRKLHVKAKQNVEV
ncbi:MAG TPA: AAA family ATPase [Terriglobales bacterium]|nr:AAA family ATPase [Terriglobales bacterium]